jgi:hypothetical protein
MAKSTDPFIAELWAALVAEKLPAGGHETTWSETATRIRNRFAKAVRQAMQSGAAFGAIPLDKIPVYATRAVKDGTTPNASKSKKKRR